MEVMLDGYSDDVDQISEEDQRKLAEAIRTYEHGWKDLSDREAVETKRRRVRQTIYKKYRCGTARLSERKSRGKLCQKLHKRKYRHRQNDSDLLSVILWTGRHETQRAYN